MMVPTTLLKSVRSSTMREQSSVRSSTQEESVPICINKPVNNHVQAGQLNPVQAGQLSHVQAGQLSHVQAWQHAKTSCTEEFNLFVE